MLLLCATPIANLGDLTPRGREAFSACSAIYCEDTRRTLTLLNHCGVKKPLFSCYRENERARAAEVVERLKADETVVYVSDAGMPGISAPGEVLIRACIENGLPYSVLPGASAVLMAAVMSGLPPMPFTFYGFFPRDKKSQKTLLETLRHTDHLVLFYESPNRVVSTLQTLFAALGDLDAAVLRELTKLHEEAARGSLSQLIGRYSETAPRGECVIAVSCHAETKAVSPESLDNALLELFKNGCSVRDASTMAAEQLGVSKKEAYSRALALKIE
jgi:16S rRNA (cytidine1402-2'-O)-methyltransferase